MTQPELTREQIEEERDAAQSLLDASPEAPGIVRERLQFRVSLCSMALAHLRSQPEKRLAALEAALMELVRLKEMKDRIDGMDGKRFDSFAEIQEAEREYNDCIGSAWKAALSALPDAGKGQK